MRARGQVLFAVVAIGVLAGAGLVAQRDVGPRTPASIEGGDARSGAWFCPHGGGPGWTVTLHLANPGAQGVWVRLTPIGEGKPGTVRTMTLGPDSEVSIQVPAKQLASATLVEYFGPWIAAGWVSLATGPETGVAAESCTDVTPSTWYAPEGTTQQGQSAYLIVSNPFAVDATFDVVLYSEHRAPVRDSHLTGVRLRPFRSVAIHVDPLLEDEPAAAAEVDVSAGRVVVASLGVSSGGGIWSAIGQPGPPAMRTVVPGGFDGGQSTLVVLVPGEGAASFSATLSGKNAPQPAAGLTQARQDPQSARAYPVISQAGRPSSIVVSTGPSSPGIVVARRAAGPGGDVGATRGSTQVSTSWVVLPTVAGTPARPGLVLENEGSATIEVGLHALVPAGAAAPADVTVSVPAGGTVGAPADFLAAVPDAAILATSATAFVAAGASTSGGRLGLANYAVSVGLPVPGATGGSPGG